MNRCIYVIGGNVGPQKIGISLSPETRLSAFRVGNPGDMRIVFSQDLPHDQCREAEKYAHWLLKDQTCGGEWFTVTPDEAAAACRTAIEAVRAGKEAPKESRSEKTCFVSFSMLDEDGEDVDAWMHAHRLRSRSAAIRCMVRFALASGVIPERPDAPKRKGSEGK